ncbi:cupin domain-containing protein [Streptomyces sp. PU-14G]|uniref:cupin domain-containing protein n=1 Tax=Streptomyces sp. PU-14G TaxID=2800808 RepID=UPI0034DF4147
MADADPGSHSSNVPVPKPLCDVEGLAAEENAPAGAVWRLAEPGRQLDANLVHVPPGRHIEPHVEPDLDVLLLVVRGSGTLGTAQEARPLREGGLMWLPHGSSRSVTAGEDGVSYLTVHRRRPGMRIRRPAGP